MALEIIGAGFGRTGTFSLKAALERLGFGPCHHMSEVIDRTEQIRLWSGVAEGRPDYDRIFAGYTSAADFPVSAFWQDVLAASPGAKVILSDRDPEQWYASFSQTILPLILDKAAWPEARRPWFEMMNKVIIGKALGGRTDRDGILAAYRANVIAARELAAEGRALVFSSRDGWEPLCDFLGVEVPVEPYPKTNPRDEFFAAARSGAQETAGRPILHCNGRGEPGLGRECPGAPSGKDKIMSALDQIRAASDRFYGALNQMAAGKAAPMADAWAQSEEVSAQHPIGGRDQGYDTVIDSFSKVAAIAGGGEIRLLEQKITAGADMAVETGVEAGTLVIAGHTATIQQRVTNVYRLVNEEWKLFHHHTDQSQAMLDILKRLNDAA